MLSFEQCVKRLKDEKRMLFIGTPIYRGYHEDYHRSMMATMLRCLELELPILIAQTRPLTIVDLGRNYILDDANKDPRVTDVFQIDSDMGWEPDDLIRLWAQEPEFVAAVGRKKNALPNDNINGWAVRVKPGRQFTMKDGLMQFDGVGAAFLRLKMTAVQKMIAAYPETIGRLRGIRPDGVPETALVPHLFAGGGVDGGQLAPIYGQTPPTYAEGPPRPQKGAA